jgi:2-keto-3-deoxy-L-rhamnonate aldolase RhmA
MTFYPKQNRILKALQKGEIPLGMQIYTGAPSFIEILAYTGFDFYMLDMEHSRVNVETMEHCIRAADAAGITTVVRVAENNHSYIRQSLESGAQGIIVPHVKNREDARKAVSSVRYPPEGKCGICPAIRAASFSVAGWDDYLEHSSRQTMVIPILEDKTAFDNLEEIFSELKPGVDAVWFGRGDLAQDLTLPGKKVDWDHPFIMEAFDRVIDISNRTDIPVMAIPWPVLTPEAAKEALSRGAKIMLYSIEQALFYNLCLDIVKQMKG